MYEARRAGVNRAEFSADVMQFICVEFALSCLRRAAMQLDELPLRGAGDQAHEDLVAITDEQVHGGARTDADAAIVFCALCEVRCALLSNFTYVGIIFLPTQTPPPRAPRLRVVNSSFPVVSSLSTLLKSVDPNISAATLAGTHTRRSEQSRAQDWEGQISDNRDRAPCVATC